MEAGAAVGLLIPATRRATATGVAALFGVFLAGHVDAIRRAYGPDGSPVQRKVHTARLPLQVPLILWAWSLRNAGRRPAHEASGFPGGQVGMSISIATGLYGVSFGALSVTSGLDFWQTMALSLLLFSGGSQFAFIGVVAGGGSGVAAMSAATLLGMRNGIYGMQLNALLHPTGWRKYVAAQLTIDESTATSTGQTDPDEQRRGFWAAGIGIYVLWNLFTAVGALAGAGLGDPKQWGLDGAAVAAFLALLWPRLKGREPVAIAVVCALATVLAVPFVPAGVPILIAAVVAAVIGWFSHGRSDEGLEPDVDPYAEHHHRPTRPRRFERRRAHEPLDLAAAGVRLCLCVEARGLLCACQAPSKPPYVPRGRHHDHRPAGFPDGGKCRGLRTVAGSRRQAGSARGGGHCAGFPGSVPGGGAGRRRGSRSPSAPGMELTAHAM